MLSTVGSWFPGYSPATTGQKSCSIQSTTVFGQKRKWDEIVETEPCGKCRSLRHTINYLREVHLKKLEQERDHSSEETERVKRRLQTEILNHAETKKNSELTSQNVVKQNYKEALRQKELLQKRFYVKKEEKEVLRRDSVVVDKSLVAMTEKWLESKRDLDKLQLKYNKKNVEIEGMKEEAQRDKKKTKEVDEKLKFSYAREQNKLLTYTKKIISEYVPKYDHEEALRQTEKLRQSIINEKALNDKLRYDTARTKKALDKLQKQYNESEMVVRGVQEQNKQLQLHCAQNQREIRRLEEKDAFYITEVEYVSDSHTAPGLLSQIVSNFGYSSDNEDAKRIEDAMAKARRQLEKKVNEILTQNRLNLNKNTHLFDKINALKKVDHVSNTLIIIMHEIRLVGNDCTHNSGENYCRDYVTKLMQKYARQLTKYEKRTSMYSSCY